MSNKHFETALEEFNDHLDFIQNNIIEEMNEELLTKTHRQDFQIFEERLREKKNFSTVSYSDLYSFKMIRKDKFNKFINYNKFDLFFVDQIEMNKNDNFANIIYNFLLSVRLTDQVFNQDDVKEKSIGLVEGLINDNFNVDDIYNIICIVYTDLFIYANKDKFLNGEEIFSKNNSKDIPLTIDSKVNNLLNNFNNSIKADLDIQKNIFSGSFEKRINKMMRSQGNIAKMIETEIKNAKEYYDFDESFIRLINKSINE